mgnify:CR=1 FL=1
MQTNNLWEKTLILFVFPLLLISSQIAPSSLSLLSDNYEKITVVAVVEQLASVAKEIGGEKVEVVTIIPANVEPHHYEPSADILVNTLLKASLIVVTSSYHFPVEDKIYQIVKEGLIKAKVIGLSDYERNGLKLLSNPKTGDINIHGFHFSISGLRAIASTIAGELINLDPANERYYKERLNSYLIRLDEVEKTIKATVKKDVRVIIYTPMLQYVINDLGLELAGIVVSEVDIEPSEKDISEMLNKLQKKEAEYILFADNEVSENPKLVDILDSQGLPYLIIPLSRFTTTPELVSLSTATLLSLHESFYVQEKVTSSNNVLFVLSIIANVILVILLILLFLKVRSHGK